MKHVRQHSGRLRRSAGFSMVEVLVAIIILSFGLLGMVGLQAAALKGNREARLQSVASGLARELAEMMRGNKDVALTSGATNPYLVAIGVGGTFQPTTPSYCLNVSTGTGCADATTTAEAQMTEWLTRLNTELPGARVTVCVDSAPYDSSGLPVWACTGGTTDVTVIKIGWTRGSTNRAATAASAIETANVRPGLVYPITAGNLK